MVLSKDQVRIPANVTDGSVARFDFMWLSFLDLVPLLS